MSGVLNNLQSGILPASCRLSAFLSSCRLITVEMFIATLAHRHVFSYKEYKNAAASGNVFEALAQIAAPSQLAAEVRGAFIAQSTPIDEQGTSRSLCCASSIGNVAPVSRETSGVLAGSV